MFNLLIFSFILLSKSSNFSKVFINLFALFDEVNILEKVSSIALSAIFSLYSFSISSSVNLCSSLLLILIVCLPISFSKLLGYSSFPYLSILELIL